MKINDLMKIIKFGESESVEFKRQVIKDIHKSIAALANANGGFLVLGVDKKGDIIGIDIESAQDRIANSVQSIIPPPKINTHKFKIENSQILLIEVEKSPNLCSIGGVVYIRIGGGIRPLSLQEILILSSEIGAVEWDSAPLVHRGEIKKAYVKHFFRKREELRGKRITERDKLRFLKSIGAVRDDKLTNAGVLCFSDPSDSLQQAKIRIVKMEMGQPQWSKKYEGPVWQTIEDVYKDLINETHKHEVIIGIERKVIGAFPARVLREAIINAVAHRNYTIFADIKIILEEHRILIKNPGGLLPGVELDDPEHIPRNPSLCNILYEMGLIERYGFGILMMKEEIGKNKGFGIEFTTGPNKFEVLIKRSISPYLDDLDSKILNALTEALKSGEISKKVNSTKPTVIRHLKKLEQLGLVKQMGKGPQVKYVLK